MSPDPQFPAPGSPVCGIRLARHDALRWADASGLALAPGDVVVVVVASEAGEQLATVAVGPDQLLEPELAESATTRVVRLALPEDVIGFGRSAASAFSALERATAHCADRGIAAPVDAWAAPDGGRLHLLFAPPKKSNGLTLTLSQGERELSLELAELLGAPVDLHVGDTLETSVLVSGPGAGLPSTWSQLLAYQEDAPSVRNEIFLNLSAGDLIQRLFSGRRQGERKEGSDS